MSHYNKNRISFSVGDNPRKVLERPQKAAAEQRRQMRAPRQARTWPLSPLYTRMLQLGLRCFLSSCFSCVQTSITARFLQELQRILPISDQSSFIKKTPEVP